MIEALNSNPNIAKLMKMPAPKGEPLSIGHRKSEDWTRADLRRTVDFKGASLKMGPRAMADMPDA